MEQFENAAEVAAARPAAVPLNLQFSDHGDDTGAQLTDLKLNNTAILITPQEVQSILAREGSDEFLPHELAHRIQDAAMTSGSVSIKVPVSRKTLKGVCDELERSIEWLESKISQIDARDRPEAITRDTEFSTKVEKSKYNFESITGGNIVVGGFVATLVSGITLGCLTGSFFGGLVGAFCALGLSAYSYYHLRSKVLARSTQEFLKSERAGECAYQEPINARLLEIYARHESTPFSSDREKRIALQEDLLEFQRSLEQTQNTLRGLTTDLHALGLALKHCTPVSATLYNEKQALQALNALEQLSKKSGKDATDLSVVLGKVLRGEDLSVASTDLEAHLDVIAAMRSSGRFNNPEIEAEFQRLLEDTAARAELTS